MVATAMPVANPITIASCDSTPAHRRPARAATAATAMTAALTMSRMIHPPCCVMAWSHTAPERSVIVVTDCGYDRPRLCGAFVQWNWNATNGPDVQRVSILSGARRRLALLGELAMRSVSDLVALICVTAFLTGVVFVAAKLLIQ